MSCARHMPFTEGYGDVSRDGFHGVKATVKSAVNFYPLMSHTADFTANFTAALP
jgi:hypothetical protein